MATRAPVSPYHQPSGPWAPESARLVHVFVILVEAAASARAIEDAGFVHPTFAEGLQSLVMRLERFALR